MLTFFTVMHIFLCVFMIFVILLQPGKDAGMGAALGGGAATSASRPSPPVRSRFRARARRERQRQPPQMGASRQDRPAILVTEAGRLRIDGSGPAQQYATQAQVGELVDTPS